MVVFFFIHISDSLSTFVGSYKRKMSRYPKNFRYLKNFRAFGQKITVRVFVRRAFHLQSPLREPETNKLKVKNKKRLMNQYITVHFKKEKAREEIQIHKLIWPQNAMLVTRTIRAQEIQHYILLYIIFNRDLFHIVSKASNISLL